jgi:hypothetical protein
MVWYKVASGILQMNLALTNETLNGKFKFFYSYNYRPTYYKSVTITIGITWGKGKRGEGGGAMLPPPRNIFFTEE